MRKYLPTIEQLAIFGLAFALLAIGWVKNPAGHFTKSERPLRK